jgi:hypothetical protein
MMVAMKPSILITDFSAGDGWFPKEICQTQWEAMAVLKTIDRVSPSFQWVCGVVGMGLRSFYILC